MRSRHRSIASRALLLVAIASSVLVPTGSSGTARTWVPMLRGDFNCDGKGDVFRYVAGPGSDRVLYGDASRRFVRQWFRVGGTYRPFTGDFNGDGCSDIFWYAGGTALDHIWFGKANHEFAQVSLRVDGYYTPVAADLDGDDRTDIVWYGPGSRGDHVWYGRRDRTFDRARISIEGRYTPLHGDFDGDGMSDLFLYAPGTSPDHLWFGTAGRTFVRTKQRIDGTYSPRVGDFDGNGGDDVLWYAPGTTPDRLWMSAPGRSFDRSAITVDGSYSPIVGDFNGDRADDVFWYAGGTKRDHVWFGALTATFSSVSVNVDGEYEPFASDMDGDGASDIYWDAGTARSYLFFGRLDRTFETRYVASDALRVAPFKPGALGTSYNPYGYVAHAMGGIDGHAYSNTREAFERNWARGFRLFEVDLIMLADGSVLAAHDRLESRYGLKKSFREARRSDLTGKRYLGKYEILWAEDLVQLLRSHGSMYLILDTKWSHVPIWRKLVSLARHDAVIHRLLPHIADQADLNAHRDVYPVENYLLALYRTQPRGILEDHEAVKFVRANRTPAVMMWYRDRDPNISLRQNASQHRRYLASFASDLQAAKAAVYVHTVTYDSQVTRYQTQQVGVYSDETFAPA